MARPQKEEAKDQSNLPPPFPRSPKATNFRVNYNDRCFSNLVGDAVAQPSRKAKWRWENILGQSSARHPAVLRYSVSLWSREKEIARSKAQGTRPVGSVSTHTVQALVNDWSVFLNPKPTTALSNER